MSALADHIIHQMPSVRGKLMADAPLKKYSWFRTGGPADVLYEPADTRDLVDFLTALPLDIPITIIGVGSNLLVRDGGVEGVVIRLGKAFAEIKKQDQYIIAGAAAMDVHVAKLAEKHALSGLEWLVGVPGTIGGAVRMNAGAYESELADVLVELTAVDRSGALHTVQRENIDFQYRACDAPSDWIFLSAVLECKTNVMPQEISRRMKEIMTTREETQPIGTRTGGSTFKNPEGMKAWQLIDEAGCRGLAVGDAVMSEKHCNFMINNGNASAADVETLGETVRERVKATSGVELVWEIRCIGRAGEPA